MTKLTSVADATKAVADQAEKVRALKASGSEKAVWQPEVELLLKLKKQLTNLGSVAADQSSPVAAKQVPTEDIAKAVADQAEKVRSLKASGAQKSVWQPEVDILLKLKKELGALPSAAPTASTSAQPVAAPSSATVATVATAEAAVAAQAEKVRQLKTGGADKAVWQPEVDRLLSLKKDLGALTGVAVATPSGSSKKASKKK